MTEFKDRLRELREEKGLSQEKLAKLLFLSQSAIAYYELGKKFPNHNTLNRLASFFDVSIDYLLGRTDVRNGITPNTPWYERDAPPTEADLEEIIKTSPQLNLFGEPLDKDAREDLLKVIQATWEIIRKKKGLDQPQKK